MNKGAVSIKKFIDHENPFLVGRRDLMTFVFFLVLSVTSTLYSSSVIKANFTTIFQWIVQ